MKSVCVLMALSIAGSGMHIDGRSPQRQRPVLIEQLTRVNDLYMRASSANVQECSVKAFVNAEFDSYPFRTVNEDIKRRIVKTQLQFARNREAFITEQKVADALNDLVQEFNLPAFAKVNVKQLRLCRMFLLQHAPTVIGATSKDFTIPAAMSPGESMLLVQFVVTQKLINPEFQIGADEWSNKVLHRARSSPSKIPESKSTAGTARLEMAPSNVKMIQIANTVSQELAKPDTRVSVAFQSLLDKLQFLK